MVTTDCSSLLTANLVEVPIGLADLEVADSREVMADLVELEVREETGQGDEAQILTVFVLGTLDFGSLVGSVAVTCSAPQLGWIARLCLLLGGDVLMTLSELSARCTLPFIWLWSEPLLAFGFGLAPLSCLRRREEFVSDREAWLAAYPDALKKATERVRARRLMKRLTMALREDGELRVKFGCRRSGRLSSLAFSAASVKLGTGGALDLKPIDEELESEVVQDCDGGDLEDPLVVPVEEPMEVPVTLSGGSEIHSDEGSDDSGDLLRVSSAVCGSSDHDPVPVPFTVMPIPEEAMAVVDELGDSVAVIPAQTGDSQVRASCSRVMSDSPGIMTESVLPKATGLDALVMDEVVVVSEEIGQERGDLAAPLLNEGLGGGGLLEGGQQVLVVVGAALKLPSTDGR
ncbi:hypothetical protein Dimus_026761 [Dionaea muscipula]